MLKVIAVLSTLLVLSLFGNYSLYQKLETKNSLINQQRQSIVELDKAVKLNSTIRDIGDVVFEGVIHSTAKSDQDFDSILKSLPTPPCKPTNTNKPAEGIKNESTIDPDVNAYYEQLHSAYTLQDKH